MKGIRSLGLVSVMVVGSSLWAQDLVHTDEPFRAAAFDARMVEEDDIRRDATGELRLYGRSLSLGASTALHGEQVILDGERVWRLAVTSPGAIAMELLLENVVVPVGATMRMVDRAGAELHPWFPIGQEEGVQESATPLVGGDEWVLEYREPQDAPFQGRFNVPYLVHAYRDVEAFTESREGSCHVNVACAPESNGWAEAIRSTVRISVVTSQGSGWCSGTLVNNVRQDCAPYILSAWHCGRLSTTAQFNQYKFYFNFQYATCAGGAYSTAQYMTGAQLKGYSNDYSQTIGTAGSDFMLLRTNVAVPASFEPYWSGWDATAYNASSTDGVCIHHPTGAPKRISSYTQTLTTGHPIGSSGLQSYWLTKWAATQNGHGITELGSSGAGLFKPNAALGPVLHGTLTGSSTGMTCTNNTGTSYFGKMSYHWTNNPNTVGQKLKAWLDPDATGTLVLGGSADPCGIPAGMVNDKGNDRIIGVHPNPNDGRMWLAWPSALVGPVQLEVVDLSGRVAYEEKRSTMGPVAVALDLTDLPDGLYMMVLRSEHARYLGKLNLQR